MPIKKRNSGFELLRILCIFGILCMHLSGVYTLSTNLPTIVTLNVINSLFNICVTCFILISGYFSITLKWDKLFSLWCIVIFYSLADAAVSYFIGTPLTLKELFKSVFPSITGKYWFFTTYMLLAVFSPYINRIPQVLPQKQFKNLLLLLVAVFYFLPTFFYFEIIKDNGKGPICMLIVYLIGRYIALYTKYPPHKAKAVLWLCLSLCTAFFLNMAATLLRHTAFRPFARDNSLCMLIGAISLFKLFQNINFSSVTINRISSYVFPTYIADRVFRNLLLHFFPYSVLDGKWYLLLYIAGGAVFIFLICILTELLRKFIFHYPEQWIYKTLKSSVSQCTMRCNRR